MWKKHHKYQHQKKVSSFNPAWCLLPPPTKPRSNNSKYQKSTIVVASSAFHANKSLLPQYPQQQSPPRVVEKIEEEPTSPIVGCMGQIRRCNTTKSTAAVVPTSSLSSWNVNVTPPASASASDSASSGVPRLENRMMMKVKGGFSSTRIVESVEGMDPPRPVEKKKVREENLISLWKRRCGEGGRGKGLELKPMQFEAIDAPRRHR